MKQYGVIEIVKNFISLIYTKIFYSNARLIRLPIYVRGRKKMKYGSGFTTGYNCRIEMIDTEKSCDIQLLIGENTKIGDNVHIAAGEQVRIGKNCLFASKVYISDISHGDYSNNLDSSSPLSAPDKRKLFTNSISIGNNVWLGENVCVLPGVRIGNGVVVGANSVVTKDIPDNIIAVGVPAIPIKKYDPAQGWIKL